MRKFTGKALAVTCAVLMAFGLVWADPQGRAMLNNAMSALSGGGATEQAFGQQYQALDIYDTALSLILAILFPWLATGDAWDRIYSPQNRAAGAGGSPTRSGGPVEYLTITDFKIGTTSFLFRAEWPVTQVFPADAIDVLFNLGLEPEYWAPIRWGVPVTQHLLEVSFEVPFDAFHLHVDGVPPLIGFFRIRPSDIWDGEDEGHIRDTWDQDDSGGPPEFPAPLMNDYLWLTSLGHSDGLPQTASRVFTGQPGMHYLISACCSDTQVLSSPIINRNSVYAWTITTPGSPTLTGSTDTFALAEGYAVTGENFQLRDFWFVSIPTNASNPTIQINLSVTPPFPPYNYVHGSIFVYVQPLKLVQSNMPGSALQYPQGSTDYFTGSTLRDIPEGGVAFITGHPQPPSLCYSSLSIPPSLSYAFRLAIETERPGYRNNSTTKLDDRSYPTNGLYTAYVKGGTFLEIAQDLMGNEMIGGKCTFYVKARNDLTGEEKEQALNFFIRGLNPTDALARTYIDNVMPDFCKPYAWAIIRHESKTKSGYIYNQFNPAGPTLHLPNKTDDLNNPPRKQWGWGMCQIDMGPFTNGATRSVSTAEVYNWRTNVLSAAEKMNESLATHNRFMGHYKAAYGATVEPPQYVPFKVGGLTMTTEQFAVMTLYNGADRATVPKSTVYTSTGKHEFWSPVAYNLNGNRQWTFHHNNKKYAELVALEMQNTQPIKE